MCQGTTVLRRKRRLSLNASKKINGRPVVWHGFRGGVQSCCGGIHSRVSCRKADEGAEKSCRVPRRRKRGLRRGKCRSRVGKTRPIHPSSAHNSEGEVSRRKARRVLREDVWASRRAIMIYGKVIVPMKKRWGEAWVRRRECWKEVDKCWLPFKRHVGKFLPGISLAIVSRYSQRLNSVPPPSWSECGFGDVQIRPGDWLQMRAFRSPTVEDLFPDSGPITLGDWQRKRDQRLQRVTRHVLPCRCRGAHRWCEECGACIYAGSNHHRPRARPARGGR